MSAKKFLREYGSAGVVAYGGVTITCMTSIYLGLRSFGVDTIMYPLETCLGKDSELLQNIRTKVQEVPAGDEKDDPSSSSINWAREGTYFGIATALDSVLIPAKLAVCLPLAQQLLKLRKRRP